MGMDSPISITHAIPVSKLAWMWNETDTRLNTLVRRAREGKDLIAASEFARWLLMSGLVSLFESCPQKFPRIDGRETRRLCVEIQQTCAKVWNSNGKQKFVGASDVESISEKLSHLTTMVEKLSSTSTTEPAPALAILRSVAT